MMPKTWTKKAAPYVKILGGVCTAFTVGSMVLGNSFTGPDKYTAIGIAACGGFLVARGIAQIVYGDDA